MPVGQTPAQTPIYIGKIITCDPTQRLVEVQLTTSGQRLQIGTLPIAMRWPMVGETWSVHFINNTPYLGEPWYPPNLINQAATMIEDIAAGDAWVNSPTGVVHVIGSKDGTTDFSFARKNIPPAPPLTSGEVLQTTGTGGSFWGPPNVSGGSALVARAYRSAAFSCGTNVWSKVPVDTVDFDPAGLFNTSTGRFTAPVAGYYVVSGGVTHNPSSQYYTLLVGVWKNGAEWIRGGETQTTGNSTNGRTEIASDITFLNQGDYLELYVFSNLAASHETTRSENYLSVASVSSLPGVTGTTTAARAYCNTQPTLPGSAWTLVPVNTRTFDPGGCFNLTNNTYVVPATGFYQVSFAGELLQGLGSGNRFSTYVTVNSTIPGSDSGGVQGSSAAGSGSAGEVSSGSGLLSLNAGDVLRLYAYVDTTGFQLNGTFWSNYLSVVQVDNSMNFTSAGGDLSGNYPNPTVEKIQGILAHPITRGIGSVTFSASTTATATISHNLSVAPTAVALTISDSGFGNLTPNTYGYTTTQFTAELVSSGAISLTVHFTWIAVA